MPTATFYTRVADPRTFACRLTARAVQSGSRVLVWAETAEEIERLDADLWQFDPTAFLPHEILKSGQAFPQDVPVVLAAGGSLPPAEPGRVVLNLSPAFWSHAPIPPERVLEIVGNSLEALDEARERFRAYRHSGFIVEHHDMQGKT